MTLRELRRVGALVGAAVGLAAALGAVAVTFGDGGGPDLRLTAAKPISASRPPRGLPSSVVVKPAGPRPSSASRPPGTPPVVVKPGDGGPGGIGGRSAVVSLRRAVEGPSSTTVKNAIAGCPAGTKVLGGGAQVIGGQGEVMLNRYAPVSNTSGEAVQASATARPPGGGFHRARAWSLEAYAVCGPPLPGLQIVFADTDESLQRVASAQVKCPAGTKVIAAGGSAGGRNGRASLRDVRPDAAGQTVTVVGADDTTLPSQPGVFLSIRAIAVCATPPPGYEVIRQQTTFDKGNHTLDLVCPDGKIAYGVGVSKIDTTGHVYLDSAAPQTSGRSNGPTRIHLATQQSPFTASSSLTGHAFCAFTPRQ
jgi:hypothetical protein